MQLSQTVNHRLLTIRESETINNLLCAPSLPECKGNCCNACGERRGYFKMESIFKRLAVKYGFTKEAGFLGLNGCKIPRPERSEVCLSYMCGRVMDNPHREKLVKISNNYSERQATLQPPCACGICKHENR